MGLLQFLFLVVLLTAWSVQGSEPLNFLVFGDWYVNLPCSRRVPVFLFL